MASDLTLLVITPDRIALDMRASSVRIPGLDGSMGILPRHAPMVAALDIGLMVYDDGSGEQTLFVAGGFAEVRDNTVRVVCEAGERPEEIDEERARAAEARARQRLDEARAEPGVEGAPQVDIFRGLASLRRAQNRLLAKRGHGRRLA